MKKITFILLAMLAFCWQSNAQDTCGTATAVTPGTTTGTLITQDSAGGQGDTLATRDSAWFTYTATGDGTIDISSCLGGADTRLYVFDDCAGTAIANNDDSCLYDATITTEAYASEITGLAVTTGTTYYIEWDDRWSADPFDWSLEFTPAPECTSAELDPLQALEDCANGQYSILVPFVNQGDATGVSDGTTTYPIIDGAAAAGPYDSGEVITLDIVHSDPACDFSFEDIFFSCPAENIDCASAEAIACGETINASTDGSTGTAEDIGCAMGVNGVWYTFTGTGGDMTVTVAADFDHRIGLASGDCGALTNIVCDDQSTGTEEHTFASVLDETYYVYVAHYADGNTTTGAIAISLTCAVVPECTAPTIDSSDVTETCDPDGTGTFTVDIVVSDAGDAGSVFSDGTNTFPVVAGTVMAGPYNSGESVTIELVSLDEDCNSTVGTFTFTCPPPAPENDDCDGALPLECGVTITGSTENSTVSGLDTTCGGFATTDGRDLFYTFVADGESSYTVSLDQPAGLFALDGVVIVYSGVCDDLTTIDCADSGNPEEVTLDAPAAGTYTVRIFDYSGVADFTLDLTCVAPPTCTAATIDSSSVSETCNADGTGTFTVDIIVSDAGDAGSVFSDGTNTFPIIAGTVMVGPYNSGDSVTIELIALDEDCSSTVGTFEFTCPIPAPDNNDIAGASNLSVGSTVCETPLVATNVGATDSGEGDPSCGVFGYNGGDVWFKVMVPASGDLTVETSAVIDSDIADTTMEIYSGTSGSLLSVECDDDDSPAGAFSLIELTGLTPGEVLLVRVWEYGDDAKGEFSICAWSPSSLSLDDNTFNGFTYYPNPVKDVLTLESPNAIDNVEVYNILGQRIVAINSENTIQNIDMSSLQAGAYFVKVAIDNQIKTLRVIKE